MIAQVQPVRPIHVQKLHNYSEENNIVESVGRIDSGVFNIKLFEISLGLNWVINQKAWQLNTGTIYVQVSRRIANTQKNNIFTLYFIHTVYSKFKYNEDEEQTKISKQNLI